MVLHCHTAATDCWFYTVTLLQQTAGSTLSHREAKQRIAGSTLSHYGDGLLVLHSNTAATDCWFYAVTLWQRTAGLYAAEQRERMGWKQS